VPLDNWYLTQIILQSGKQGRATHRHARTHAHKDTHTHRHARTQTRTHGHARTHRHARTYTGTGAHTHRHTHKLKRTHARTHTHTLSNTGKLLRNVVHDGSSRLTSLSTVALTKIRALIFVDHSVQILELNRYHKTPCFKLTCVNTLTHYLGSRCFCVGLVTEFQ
jgi:hypothetical protein